MVNKGFSVATLKGVRSALRDPLKFYFPNFDIVEDSCIKKLIQYVKSHNTRESVTFPAGNLDLVVCMLKLRDDNDLEFVFKKTLFLCFLVCPYRIAEFRAVSLSASSFSPLHALLKPHIAFQSKNQTDAFTPNPIIIQAYEEDSDICPVKLLNSYIKITQAKCREKGIERPDQLWLNVNLKPISVFIMRKWIKEIIFMGDPNASSKLRVHSMRAQVASHLMVSGVSVKEILSVMNWKQVSTFSKFYARLGIRAAVKAVLAGHPIS